MASFSFTPMSHSQFLFNKAQLTNIPPPMRSCTISSEFLSSRRSKKLSFTFPIIMPAASSGIIIITPVKSATGAASSTAAGEAKTFVEELRSAAMKLHTRDQSKEGEREVNYSEEPQARPVAEWDPKLEGFLKFLVDMKLVFDTLEGLLIERDCLYTETSFIDTGLERSEKLAKDLEWFKEQGHVIPQPSAPGLTYAQYLKALPEKDSQAVLCHLYMVYFAQSAGGGRAIGRKVAEKLLDKKVLEFYKFGDGDHDVSKLVKNVKEKLNKAAESWTREEKNHCLEETEISLKLSAQILRLILS